jgi:hypothetical protein
MSEKISIVLSVVAGVAGIASILAALLRRRREQSVSFRMKGENVKRIEIPADTSAEDIKKLIEVLHQAKQEKRIEIPTDSSPEAKELGEKVKQIIGENVEIRKGKPPNDAGLVIIDFLICIVPGVIALLFAGTYLYLLMANRQDPNYETPKELSSAMTTIIGYLFGMGVSHATDRAVTLTGDEVRRLSSK